MNPMKKKMMRIMLSLLLVTVLVSAFSHDRICGRRCGGCD